MRNFSHFLMPMFGLKNGFLLCCTNYTHCIGYLCSLFSLHWTRERSLRLLPMHSKWVQEFVLLSSEIASYTTYHKQFLIARFSFLCIIYIDPVCQLKFFCKIALLMYFLYAVTTIKDSKTFGNILMLLTSRGDPFLKFLLPCLKLKIIIHQHIYLEHFCLLLSSVITGPMEVMCFFLYRL